MSDDLKERVQQFNMMSLPGQPIGMHMGTSYLVNDLWREVERLRREMKMHLPILQALEAKPSAWEWYTDGTGVATLNGYRAALQGGTEDAG